MKDRKKEDRTSLPIRFYIIMLLVGVFTILLSTLMHECEHLKKFISDFLMDLLKFLAAGIFPAVIVALITDCANTKQKKKEYEEFYEDSINVLKRMCENLPTTLHTCIADIYQQEGAPETAWDKKNTFRGWCLELVSKDDTEQITYMNQEFLQIKAEAEKALRNLSAYQGWRDKDKNDALDDLIKSCNLFFTRAKKSAGDDNSTWKWNCNPDKCVKAVLNLFPPELSENKDIKLGYTQKFNSYDYST